MIAVAAHANRVSSKKQHAQPGRASFPPVAASIPSTNGTLLQRKASCACGGDCPRCQRESPKPHLQTQLAVSTPGDHYEREADRVADYVMQMTVPVRDQQAAMHRRSAAVVQRKCAQCDAEEELIKKKEGPDQGTASNQSRAVPAMIHEALRAPGQSLDRTTRAFMEPRFGHDFTDVRLHADHDANRAASQINAKAFTYGHHIWLGRGQSEYDRHLLAHELAHVIQQSGQQPVLRRKVLVEPDAAAAADVLDRFNELCPEQTFNIDYSDQSITTDCQQTTTHSCECLCDATSDTKRTYTIRVLPDSGSTEQETLYDGTVTGVPMPTFFPNTVRGKNPVITLPASDSDPEFGILLTDGSAFWRPRWRVMGHELCGHARLNQTYGGSKGNRPGHDKTIDTENTIAAEHGGPARGHFADPRQGESFHSVVGDRSKIVFWLVDGLHFEAP